MNWKCLAICLLITTSGCTIPEPLGAPTDVKFNGEMETHDSQFTIQGEVIQRRGEEKLSAVAICGYTEEKDLLFSKQVAPFESEESIEVTAEQRPEHVIIYSDEFWNSDVFASDTIDAVEYYEHSHDSVYFPHWASNPDELPVDTDRPLENGCPS